MKKKQNKSFNEYLALRDNENSQPYSWYDIYCNNYNHKAGLEKIVGKSLTVAEYQTLLDNRTKGRKD